MIPKLSKRSLSTVFTALQPTGSFHLGNYIGSIERILLYQNDSGKSFGNIFLCIADLHAQTKRSPFSVKSASLDAIACLISCGVDLKKVTIFKQSNVPHHLELFWILLCMSSVKKLERMIQWKEKSKATASLSHAGLLTYPILQAADILVHNFVPVGFDQSQHLELTVDLGKILNNQMRGFSLNLPKAIFPDGNMKISDLRNPEKKMSKSSSSIDGCILLTDTPDAIARKVKRAVTDDIPFVSYDPFRRPGVSNLINILQAITRKSTEDLVKAYSNYSMERLKKDLSDELITILTPIQKEYCMLRQEVGYLESLFMAGSQAASLSSEKTISKIRESLDL